MPHRRRPDPEDDRLTDAERRLFEEEMRDVRRIDRGLARVVTREKPAPVPVAVARPAAAGGLVVEVAGEQVRAFDASLPATQRRALRQRRSRPEAVLDLHGLRAADAAGRVERFLAEARHAGHRHVLIVTGRGLRSGPSGPVLRQEVVRLLTEGGLQRYLLGLVTAPPALGGPGALLLWLRG
jgi:DNA-nicking Smr family endonuclease